MQYETLYRYTSNDEGIWSAGKRLLPEELAGEALEARKWMPKPDLDRTKNYRFYLTPKGMEMYESTLLKVHQKYLQNIKKEAVSYTKVLEVGPIAYEDEYQVVVEKQVPQKILDYGFDFSWAPSKVWALDIPTEEMDIRELTWHFSVPFWNTPNGGYYNLTPEEVKNEPEAHQEEYNRTMKADMSHPLDIMFWKGRWVLLDGLHRLLKASILGHDEVQVRKVPEDKISQIKI